MNEGETTRDAPVPVALPCTMRRCLSAVSMVIAVALAGCATGTTTGGSRPGGDRGVAHPAAAAPATGGAGESRDVRGFTSVELTSFGDLQIDQTGTEFTIEAAPDVLPQLTSEVSGGVLRLGVVPGTTIRATTPVVYRLTVAALDSVAVSCEETSRPRTCRPATADISGAGDMTLSGTVDLQVVTISGTGEYDGENLAEHHRRDRRRRGRRRRRARELPARRHDPRVGSVEYIGNPEVSQNIRGAGSSSDADDGRGRSGAAQQRLERRRVGERVGRSRRARCATRSASSPAARSIPPARPCGVSPAPVLRRGEHRRGRDDRAQVGEQRPQRVLERQRVPRRAGRRADEHGLAGERVAVQDVEEGLEQPAVRRGEDRRDGDQPVSAGDGVQRRPQFLFGNPVTRLSARSRACSRSSTTSTVASTPRSRRAATVARQPVGQQLVDDGTDSSALVDGQRASSHLAARRPGLAASSARHGRSRRARPWARPATRVSALRARARA